MKARWGIGVVAAAALVSAAVLLASCGSGAPGPKPEAQATSSAKQAAPQVTAQSAPAASQPRQHHEAAGGHEEEGAHMKHMAEVKEWLKKELGEDYEKPVPDVTAAQLAEGKKVFEQNCAPCHGMTGKGDGPAAAALPTKPADFTDPEHSAYYSDAGRIHIIEKGSPGTPMVGWEQILSEEQIRSVYGYVKSLRKGSAEGGEHEHGDHDHN